ncbi:MAG: GNAT family N-acetyltransferase [Acidimicrobiales bacterium]|nr:GNAT family N-acetyltransferase [Acidimicrobiales bacterium]
MSEPMFVPVVLPDDLDELVAFLCSEPWPFHGTVQLSPDAVATVSFVDDATESHWVAVDDRRVGLIRLFDLDDIPEGAPLFDVRIAGARSSQGLGTEAVRWSTDHLFSSFPELHRIEATTRDDNLAMQRVLDRAGYTLEGRLRESWPSSTGRRHDTLLYGVLRTDPRTIRHTNRRR